jgi:hypothetical protein
MAKLAPIAADESQPPLALTDEHRASAKARGSDIDVMLSILHAAIGDVAIILREIIAAAPPDDRNLKTLQAKLELFRGEARLFAS